MSGVQGSLSKLKKKHFRVKHQKVKLFRANEPILSVLMWGVNHTVSTKFIIILTYLIRIMKNSYLFNIVTPVFNNFTD